MNERGGGGGGGDEAPAPEKVDPIAEAQANLAAKRATDPGAAALAFDIQSQYAPQLASLYSGIKEQMLPGGAGLGQQLFGTVGTQLASPTGYTPEQQASMDALRGNAQNELMEAMRTRANLGGGLFGGRSAASEAQSVADLQNQFVQEDIANQMAQQQFNQQMALALLGTYLGQSVPSLSYTSPVVGADTQYQTTAGQNNLTAQLQAQQQQQQMANQAALYSSLFQGLGSATGGFLGGSAYDNLMTK